MKYLSPRCSICKFCKTLHYLINIDNYCFKLKFVPDNYQYFVKSPHCNSFKKINMT